MAVLDVVFADDAPVKKWNDGRPIHHVTNFTVSGLRDGTVNGEPSVALLIELENGEHVVAETTLRLFLTAADAMKARYGDPRT
jgi:hypothetical protein